jgi:hypothetical protein
MNFESLDLFLLVLAPFIAIFIIEALVIFFYKLKGFWRSLGLSILINLVSFALIYFIAAPFLSLLGYDLGKFNGLNLSLPVVSFLTWFSIIVDGILLQVLNRQLDRKKIFIASIVMNVLSYFFFYFFIINSH